MRKVANILIILMFSTSILTTLPACTKSDVGTGVGAAAGAGIGYAVGRGPGAVIGGVGGALIGKKVGESW